MLLVTLLPLWAGLLPQISSFQALSGVAHPKVKLPSLRPLFSTKEPQEKKSFKENKSFKGSFESSSNELVGSPVLYEDLTIGVMRETFPGEKRVSQSPDSVAALVKAGFNVIVQSGGKRDDTFCPADASRTVLLSQRVRHPPSMMLHTLKPVLL